MSNGELVKKRGRGQPTKFTPDRKERILKALRQGNYLEVSCTYAGVDYTTFAKWRQRAERKQEPEYVDFFNEVKLAQAEAELAMVQCVRKSANDGNWAAAMTFLERRYPEKWARRSRDKLEITTNESTVSADGIRAAILAAIGHEQPALREAAEPDRVVDGTATRRDAGDNGQRDTPSDTNGDGSA